MPRRPSVLGCEIHPWCPAIKNAAMIMTPATMRTPMARMMNASPAALYELSFRYTALIGHLQLVTTYDSLVWCSMAPNRAIVLNILMSYRLRASFGPQYASGETTGAVNDAVRST